MGVYNLWMEGFACTGNFGTAQPLGLVEAETFESAVKKRMAIYPDSEKYFNPEKLTYWGCGIFDNEADARKVFG